MFRYLSRVISGLWYESKYPHFCLRCKGTGYVSVHANLPERPCPDCVLLKCCPQCALPGLNFENICLKCHWRPGQKHPYYSCARQAG